VLGKFAVSSIKCNRDDAAGRRREDQSDTTAHVVRILPRRRWRPAAAPASRGCRSRGLAIRQLDLGVRGVKMSTPDCTGGRAYI